MPSRGATRIGKSAKRSAGLSRPSSPGRCRRPDGGLFRLYVRKTGKHGFDVENIPKLIVDAFARVQIERDRSEYPELAIYEDDKIESVGMVQVAGERCGDDDSTAIQIYGRRL